MPVVPDVYFEMDPRWLDGHIVRHDDGSCSLDDIRFECFEDARQYVLLRNEFDLARERLFELELGVEKVLALREGFRAHVSELIDKLGSEYHADDAETIWTEFRDGTVSDLAVKQRKTERAVSGQLDRAAVLQSKFPATLIAWMDGEIHAGHVRVIQTAAEGLADDVLPQFEEAALRHVRSTPAQFAKIANRIARRLQEPPTTEQVEEAKADRAVWLEQQRDGMTHVTVKTTPVLAAAAYDRLRQAFQRRDEHDQRSLHQHMSDSAMRLLITGTAPAAETFDAATETAPDTAAAGAFGQDLRGPATKNSHTADGTVASTGVTNGGIADGSSSDGSAAGSDPGGEDSDLIGVLSGRFMEGISARVTVTMPATLLTQGATTDGMPHAELPDGTLVDDQTALTLAAGVSSWTRLFTDPVTGVAITADSYQPTASLRRLIIGRDQHCRFPGCHRPAVEADLDHTIDWQYGGKTTPGNLAALCRRHHVLKHKQNPRSGWDVMQTRPGELLWLGPNGNLHRNKPDPVPTALSPPGNDGTITAMSSWDYTGPVPSREESPF